MKAEPISGMELRRIALDDPDCELVRTLNREAFPPNEMIEIDKLFSDPEERSLVLLGIYREERFAGFCIVRENPDFAYLAYFAVAADCRCQGVGSGALRLLRDYYPGRQVVVECEAPDDKAANQPQRLRRRDFYHRNGFCETGWYMYYMDAEFELLCSEAAFNKPGFDALIAEIHAKVPFFNPVPYRKDTPMHPEPIGGGILVYTSEEHRFGTDAFLLTAFSHYKQKDTAVELGTGCGIIPLLMQKHRPPKRIYAVDVQENAVAQLTAGIAASHAAGVVPVCADLRELWDGAPLGQADLVICNPPYQPPGSGFLAGNDSQRIARHGLLCTPEDVCTAAARLLNFGGRLCLCGRPERLPDYICAMRSAGIEPKHLRLVQKNAASEPWLFLLEGKKGAAPFLRIDAPFLMYENGELTAEAAALYDNGGDKA